MFHMSYVNIFFYLFIYNYYAKRQLQKDEQNKIVNTTVQTKQ